MRNKPLILQMPASDSSWSVQGITETGKQPTATADLKTTKSQVGPDVFISHRGKGVCKETPREYPHRERQQCLGNWKETFTCNPGQMEPVPNALGQAGMITILERSNDVYLHTCHFQNKYHTNVHKSTQLLFFISHISPIRCNCT